ncbi:MAG: efflux RND transporter periplasmic adaptor subunit, partial [Proteobacteria bacterium]|nr:efflux RND transporter periplasmic adaptor subunit [Pseudomonadota bacterium]
ILATITDLHDMWIMAYVSEKNLGQIKLGQSAEVFVDSFPQKPFPGKVSYISTEAEFTPKNIQTKEERVKLVYAVKVQIDNTKELLKVGMPADVVISASQN